jgi:hypothetical protein
MTYSINRAIDGWDVRFTLGQWTGHSFLVSWYYSPIAFPDEETAMKWLAWAVRRVTRR